MDSSPSNEPTDRQIFEAWYDVKSYRHTDLPWRDVESIARLRALFANASPTVSDAVQSSAAAAKPDPGQVGQAGDTDYCRCDGRANAWHIRGCEGCYLAPRRDKEIKRELLAKIVALRAKVERPHGGFLSDTDDGYDQGLLAASDAIIGYFE